MKNSFLSAITAVLLFACGLFATAQQPQTQNAPLYAVNSKFVNGAAPGYWTTAGTGLSVNVSGGTAFCAGTVVQYAAGTLSLTASTTNYIYLNTGSSCAPAVKTTAFAVSDIPIAIVVTNSSGITSVNDVRNEFTYSGPSGSSTTGPQNTIAAYNGSGGGSSYAQGHLNVHGDSTGNNFFVPGEALSQQVGGTWYGEYTNEVNSILANSAFTGAPVASIVLGPNYTGDVTPIDTLTAQAAVPMRTVMNTSEGAFDLTSINPGPMADSWNAGFLFNCVVSQSPNAQSGGFNGTGHSQCLSTDYNLDIPGYYHGAIFPAQPNGGFQAELQYATANIYSAAMNKSFMGGSVNANGAGDDQMFAYTFNNNYGGQDHSADEGWHIERLVSTIGAAEFQSTLGSVTPEHASGYTQLWLPTISNPSLGVMRLLLDDTRAVSDTVTAVSAGDGSGDVSLTMTASTYPVSTKVTLANTIEPPLSLYYTKTLEPVTVNTTVDLSVAQPLTSNGPQIGFISDGSAECAAVQSYGAYNSTAHTQVVNVMLSDHHNNGDTAYVGGMACHALTIDVDVTNGIKSTFYVFGSTANNTLAAGRLIGAGIDGAWLKAGAVHVYPAARVLDVRPTAGNSGDDYFPKVEGSAANWTPGDTVESGLMATSQNDTFYYALTDNSPYTRGSTYWYVLQGNQAGNGRDFYLFQNQSATAPGWLFHWEGLIGGGFDFDHPFNAAFLQQFNCGWTLVTSDLSKINQTCAGAMRTTLTTPGASFLNGWTLDGDVQIVPDSDPNNVEASFSWANGIQLHAATTIQSSDGLGSSGLTVTQSSIAGAASAAVFNGVTVSGVTNSAAYFNGNVSVNGTLTMNGSNAIATNALTMPGVTNCVVGTDNFGHFQCNPNALTALSYTATTNGGGAGFTVINGVGGPNIGTLANDLEAFHITAETGAGGNSGTLTLEGQNYVGLKGDNLGVTVQPFLAGTDGSGLILRNDQSDGHTGAPVTIEVSDYNTNTFQTVFQADGVTSSGALAGVSIAPNGGITTFGGPITFDGPLTGQATAPSGSCSTNGAWVLSQDGHATYCDSGTWTTKI